MRSKNSVSVARVPYGTPFVRRYPGRRSVVTTFKDFPRLPERWREELRGDVLALGIRLEITRGKQLWESQLCAE